MQSLELNILRIAIAVSFIYHGSSKIFSPEKWYWLGSQMPILKFEALATFWGFMASFSEFFGGVFLLFGFFIRPSAFLILITMLVATHFHYLKNESFELPLLYALCSLVLLVSKLNNCSVKKKRGNLFLN